MTIMNVASRLLTAPSLTQIVSWQKIGKNVSRFSNIMLPSIRANKHEKTSIFLIVGVNSKSSTTITPNGAFSFYYTTLGESLVSSSFDPV